MMIESPVSASVNGFTLLRGLARALREGERSPDKQQRQRFGPWRALQDGASIA